MRWTVTISLLLVGIVTNVAMADESVDSDSLEGKTIRACGDGAEWPPFHYFKRDGKKITEEVTGYTVDLLQAILNSRGINLEVELPPWKRCLSDTKSGKYQIALDSSFNEQRAKTYLLSAQHYTLTPAFFYLKQSNPTGLSIDTSADLWEKGPVCGLFGYNYEGFAPGIRNFNVDMGAKTFKELIRKAKKMRCATFLARLEILTGFSAIGTDYLNDEFAYSPLPDGKADPFYLLISRRYEQKYELKDIIDTGIARLRNEDRLQIILKKYVKH